MESQETRPNESLSVLLGMLRVRSTLWCRSAMRAPWGFAIRERPVAAFHLVVAGGCELEVAGAGRYRLEAGDLIVVPTGAAHAARSDPDAPVRFLDDILAARPPRGGRLDYGGTGASTDLVCGGFEVSDPAAEPLLRLLPPVLIAKGSAGFPRADVRAVLEMLLRELRDPRSGADALVTRLSDLLLALVIRGALEADGSVMPWSDTAIVPVVAAMKDQPAHGWTIAEFAQLAHLSRSVFTERFRVVTGEPPMRYLRRVRLARAAALLRQDGDKLQSIAESTGFSSAASLSRAFRDALGVSPRGYRASGAAPQAFALADR